MDEKSAELTKYAANSFLVTTITFMNEIANLCEKLGANVDDVRRSIGYGGSCFPKDVQALAKSSQDVDYDFKILQSVMNINKKQKTKLIPKVKDYFGGDLQGKPLASGDWPLSPLRMMSANPPALYIDELLAAGAKVKVFDPEADGNVK